MISKKEEEKQKTNHQTKGETQKVSLKKVENNKKLIRNEEEKQTFGHKRRRQKAKMLSEKQRKTKI